mgnify:CR=1 FL=1
MWWFHLFALALYEKLFFGSYIKIKLLLINFEFILIKKMNLSLLMSFKREIQ